MSVGGGPSTTPYGDKRGGCTHLWTISLSAWFELANMPGHLLRLWQQLLTSGLQHAPWMHRNFIFSKPSTSLPPSRWDFRNVFECCSVLGVRKRFFGAVTS